MPNNASIQSIHSFQSSLPAALMASELDVRVLRRFSGQNLGNGNIVTNALLRKDEWKSLDERLVQVARQRLTGIADLRNAGLVQNLGGLGTLLSEYERMSDMNAAEVNMSGVTPASDDTVDFDLVSVPVPIIHKDFSLNIRRLLASRRLGDALDTTQVAVATRKVADQLESILFNGVSMTVGGNSIYGYTTHPNRNTGSAAGDFGTITNIFTTVNAMVAAAEADNYFGPYVLYVAKAQYAEMRAVYTDGSGQTAMQRCIDAIPALTAIKPADVLAAGSLVLVTMLPDVIDLAVAQDLTVVEWDNYGGMQTNFKVMTAQVPRIKADKEGRSGIVHYTGA